MHRSTGLNPPTSPPAGPPPGRPVWGTQKLGCPVSRQRASLRLCKPLPCTGGTAGAGPPPPDSTGRREVAFPILKNIGREQSKIYNYLLTTKAHSQISLGLPAFPPPGKVPGTVHKTYYDFYFSVLCILSLMSASSCYRKFPNLLATYR